MKYKNARTVIPEKLLLEIRQYIPEGLLYIPGTKERKKWGSQSELQLELADRNRRILMDYQKGKTVIELARRYYLSESSIYRIIKDTKAELKMSNLTE
ncbi:CD3324 family protein [Anaerosporobacter faecicola]|uniref:CD3324 family protein n=1 Tax=Anaerosporobacter faecicola TaxID=2718714 RepID=UPI001438AA14|nr:CD3324 family protein [Anaerosporobacter faecicola]